MATNGWYYAKGQERIGPHFFTDLQNLATSGILLRTDMVWNPEESTWKRADIVPKLFDGAVQVPTSRASGLVSCEKCRSQVSDSATSCPQCGHPQPSSMPADQRHLGIMRECRVCGTLNRLYWRCFGQCRGCQNELQVTNLRDLAEHSQDCVGKNAEKMGNRTNLGILIVISPILVWVITRPVIATWLNHHELVRGVGAVLCLLMWVLCKEGVEEYIRRNWYMAGFREPSEYRCLGGSSHQWLDWDALSSTDLEQLRKLSAAVDSQRRSDASGGGADWIHLIPTILILGGLQLVCLYVVVRSLAQIVGCN
jgi:GYF domain 2